jgi:hypothetical protein
VLPETRQAVDQLESDIVAIKLDLLRHHPGQPTLPGMEHLVEGKHEDTSASCPDLLSNALGS